MDFGNFQRLLRLATERGMALTAEQFGQLALEQLDTLVRVAVSLTANRTEADDLVQETYLRALGARTQFEEREYGLRPWLLRIMHNTHLTRVARAKKRPTATDPVNLDMQTPATIGFPAI